MKRYYIAMMLLLVIGFGAAALNQTLAGPGRSDQQKVDDLSSLETAVTTYVSQHQALPVSLGDTQLDDGLRGRIARYAYHALPTPKSKIATPVKQPDIPVSISSQVNYQLCTTFKSDTAKSTGPISQMREDFSRHPMGYYCFTQTATLD